MDEQQKNMLHALKHLTSLVEQGEVKLMVLTWLNQKRQFHSIIDSTLEAIALCDIAKSIAISRITSDLERSTTDRLSIKET